MQRYAARMHHLIQTDLHSRAIPFSPRQALLAVLVTLFAALSIQYTFKAVDNRSAILRWREQLQHLDDENIYTRYAYPNPPIMAILLEPVVHLPPLLGSLVWFYIKASMAVLAILWTFRLVESADGPFPLWAQGLTVALAIRPILGDLTHGNVNLFILFLVIAALLAFKREHDRTSGVLLALAIACKLTPALFVPYFVWKRAWKALAGCLVGLVFFVFLIPGAYLGSERNWTLLRSWVDQMVTPYVVKGNVTSEHQNQSFPGLLYRLATRNPSFLDDKGAPERYDNFAELEPHVAKRITQAAMLFFVGLAIYACRTPLAERSSWRLSAEFGLIVLGMLLFSERTWKHHCVTLLLPFAVICYYLACERSSRRLRVYMLLSLAVVFLLMSLTSTTLTPLLDAKMAQVYGAYVWGYLVLGAALIVLLRTKPGLGIWPCGNQPSGYLKDLIELTAKAGSAGDLRGEEWSL
jgi:alpha-1,2-mannosyltransferase